MTINTTIPKSWSDISLKKFEELVNVMDSENNNPYETSARIIAVLTDAPYEEIRKWPVSVLQSSELSGALEFIKKDPKKRMPSESITLGGKKYKINLYPQKWTAGQWLDYTSVSKEESNIGKMARLIACFIVPEKCEYGKGYDFDRLVKTINENMDVETALGLTGFFQLVFDAFKNSLLDYSDRELKKLKKSTRRQGSRSNRNHRDLNQDTRRNGQSS